MARTLVRGQTQLMPESIYDAQIALDANIQLSKIENYLDIVTTTSPVNGDIDLGGFKITNAAPGTDASDLVTKAQLDSVSAGLDPKESVRVATTVAGGNINVAAGGLQVIDGVTLVAGDRVLVKDQTNPVENGIYVAAAGAWIRSEDADGTPANEVSGGMFTFVESGTVNAGTGWVVVADGNLVPGTDAINFTQFAGAGSVIGGLGIAVSGTLITADVDNVTLINTGGTGDKIAIKALGVGTTHLAADSVTAAKLNSDVAGLALVQAGDGSLDVAVDNITIEVSADALQLKLNSVGTGYLIDDSVTAAKVNADVAGNGLVQNVSGALDVNVDNTTLEIVGDAVKIKAGGVGTTELADDSVTAAKVNADVAGNGLVQNVSGALDVNVDGSTLVINSDTIEVNTTVMLAAANYIVREPHNAVTDGQTQITLNNVPVLGTEMVFVNGVLMEAGAGNDYTISGAVITFNFGLNYHPSIAEKRDKVSVTYFK